MSKQLNNVTYYEGRSVEIGERVEVYYNLHKGGFSIKSLDKANDHKGKVVAYSPNVIIENASFHASNATLKRILEKKQKAVYAVVRGYLKGFDTMNPKELTPIHCNPYVTGDFKVLNTDKSVKKAKTVYFYDKYCAGDQVE